MKQLLLIIAFALSFIAGYSQTSQDTTLTDITGGYKCTLPSLSNDIKDLRIAIIPLNLIGKKNIAWNNNQQQLTAQSEKDFENSLLSCSENIILDKQKDTIKTTRKKLYCLRQGYEDYAMGKTYQVNYVSVKKSNLLVVIEFAAVWKNCANAQDQQDLIEACEKEEAAKRERIFAFVDEVVNKISFSKMAK